MEVLKMNKTIIGLLILGLVVALVIGANAFVNDSLEKAGTISCGTCGNSCTKESGCSLATCGATQGKTCGCGK